MRRSGLLIVNLGTPDNPETPAVRRYLREFLMDRRVIDLAYIWRWMLVHLLILPFRPKKSAAAYKKIWTNRGSPLAFHTADLAAKMRAHFGSNVMVRHAMRYQNPSIASALHDLKRAGVNHLVIAPMFPQYSAAAWGSAVAKCYEILAEEWNIPSVNVLAPFYNDPSFIEVFTDKLKSALSEDQYDHVLFSFHGLPERHCSQSDLGNKHCHSVDCCKDMRAENLFCYKAHCETTAHAIARGAGLAAGSWTICYQSRLGRTPWIKPYTDVLIDELATAGKKRVLLISPSFVADCLETLEEISVRGQEQFRAGGGEALVLIPSLNSEQAWVEALAKMCTPLL